MTGYIAEDESDAMMFVIARVLRRSLTPLDWPPTVRCLDQIGVAHSYRQRDGGHQLLECVRALADEALASRLYLTTWEFDTDAHRIFETEGVATELRRMSMA